MRTLQRHLAGSNSSFHDILQEARLGLAFRYLEESDRPLAEVAELLGFSALRLLALAPDPLWPVAERAP